MLRSASSVVVFATNRPKLDSTQKCRAIDVRKLMADLKLQEGVLWVVLEKLGSLNTGVTGTCMAANLVEILLSTAVDVAPREECQRGRQGWCARVEAQKKIGHDWVARERARVEDSAVLSANSRKKAVKKGAARH